MFKGLINGNGMYNFSFGDVYLGECKNGVFHGNGYYLFHDGERYEG